MIHFPLGITIIKTKFVLHYEECVSIIGIDTLIFIILMIITQRVNISQMRRVPTTRSQLGYITITL